jgi:hypothetical protein
MVAPDAEDPYRLITEDTPSTVPASDKINVFQLKYFAVVPLASHASFCALPCALINAFPKIINRQSKYSL